MGWSSWNRFVDRITDGIIREIADAMVLSGIAAAGYQFVNPDDTLEGGRVASGLEKLDAQTFAE